MFLAMNIKCITCINTNMILLLQPANTTTSTCIEDCCTMGYTHCVQKKTVPNINCYNSTKACQFYLRLCTHKHTEPFNGLWSGTTRAGWYQKKHPHTHTHPDHRTSLITFLHLQRSMASSLFSLRA